MQLGEHDFRGEKPLAGQARGWGGPLENVTGVAPSYLKGPIGQRAFQSGTELSGFHDPVMELLKESGDASHHRGLDLQHVERHLFDAFGIGDAHPAIEHEVVCRPLENMAERQKRKDGVLVVKVKHPAEAQDVGHDVGMGQHDSLGRSGGAGRVDDGGHVFRSDPLTNLQIPGRVALPDTLAVDPQVVETQQAVGFRFFQVHDQRGLETGDLRLDFPNLLQLFLCGQNDDLDPGVVEESLDLGRGQRRIYGNVDRAGGENGDV